MPMNILVGISGSIASYRSPDFVKALVTKHHSVQCIVTKSAEHFVGLKALETFCGQKPLSNDHFSADHLGTDHIALARWANVMVMYGATANTLAKLASGTADDFLSTQYLAFRGPVIAAPAMNPYMWSHPAVTQNVNTLKSHGVHFCGPISGVVACGEDGIGHISDIADIIHTIESLGSPREP